MKVITAGSLVIRPFVADDWRALQALAVDKETLKLDPHDPPWPTSDDGCRSFAEYLAERPGQYYAVSLKRDQSLIGLLAFNHIDDTGQLELGYQFTSAYQDMVHDREALAAIIEHAFTREGVRAIDTRTNSEWAEQIAPLKAFGFEPIGGDPGHLGITAEAWKDRT